MKRRSWRAAFVLAVLIGSIPAPFVVARAQTCDWEVVPTPAGAGSVRGADLGPKGQILAVGDRLTDRGVVGGSMRWDGSGWTGVPVPPAAGARRDPRRSRVRGR